MGWAVSTVKSITQNNGGVGVPFQRTGFYDPINKIYWQFYHDEDDETLRYRRRGIDAQVWTEPASSPLAGGGAVVDGNPEYLKDRTDFSIWYEGTYVYVVYIIEREVAGNMHDRLYWIRGTIGTTDISWGTRRFIQGSYNTPYPIQYPTTCIDSSDRPIVGCYQGGDYFEAIRNPNVDGSGTWVERTLTAATSVGCVLPMTDNKIAVVAHVAGFLDVFYYDGTGAWTAGGNWTTYGNNIAKTDQQSWSALTIENDIFIAFRDKNDSNKIKMVYRAWGDGGWITETVYASTQDEAYPAITKLGSTVFYVAWGQSNIVYFCARSGGVWGSRNVVKEEPNLIESAFTACYSISSSSQYNLAWVLSASSIVRHARLVTSTSPYGVNIGGATYAVLTLDFTTTQPSKKPDSFSAQLAGYVTGMEFGDEVIIMKNNRIVWRGYLEDIEYTWEKSGRATNLSGRCKKLLTWKKQSPRMDKKLNNDNVSLFEHAFYPNQAFKFFAHCPRIDRDSTDTGTSFASWGIDPTAIGWTITVTNLTTGSGNLADMYDRNYNTMWTSNENYIVGQSVNIDLGAEYQVMGMIVVCEDINDLPSVGRILAKGTVGVYQEVDSWVGSSAMVYAFAWETMNVRYLQIQSQITSPAVGPWSIREILVYKGETSLYRLISTYLTFEDDQWSTAPQDNQKIITSWERLIDRLNSINAISYLPDDSNWEWWINLSDVLRFGARRGHDKSASINFQTGVNILSISRRRNIKNSVNRMRIMGADWDDDPTNNDGYDSEWRQDTTKQDLHGVYEMIERNNEMEADIDCVNEANFVLAKTKNARNEIEITVIDTYVLGEDINGTSSNLWYVGDDVNVHAPQIGIINQSYRIKRIKVSYSADSGEKIVLELDHLIMTIVETILDIKEVQKMLTNMERANAIMGRVLRRIARAIFGW